MRKLHSLISLLLVLLMLAPCALADAPLLQAASDWNLADTRCFSAIVGCRSLPSIRLPFRKISSYSDEIC